MPTSDNSDDRLFENRAVDIPDARTLAMIKELSAHIDNVRWALDNAMPWSAVALGLDSVRTYISAALVSDISPRYRWRPTRPLPDVTDVEAPDTPEGLTP